MPHRAEPQGTQKTYGTALFVGTAATHGRETIPCKMHRWKTCAPITAQIKMETLGRERLKDYEQYTKY